jgi:hypothetical protein
MAVISTGAHPKALWPGIFRWTHMKYSEHPLEITEIFGAMNNSGKKYEETVEATGFGLAPVKAEGAATTYDSHSQGPTTRYMHVAYSLGYIVTREELDDNQYPEKARNRSTALAFSFRQTKEIVGANILNRGFNVAFAGGDGKPLFATDHPGFGGGSQSNKLAVDADLSEAALEDLIVQISQAENNRGLKIAIKPQKLIVHPANMFEAHRIMYSTLQPGTANNDVNAVRNMGVVPGGVAVNHYLTNEDAWYLKTDVPNGLMGFQRTPFEFTRDNDFDTINAKAKGYERYTFGWSDWRGIYGSEGSA